LRDKLAQIMDTGRFEILQSNTDAIQHCARQLGYQDPQRLFFAFEKR
jgi:hypothetical protein